MQNSLIISLNAIFSKIGRTAYEEVVLELVASKSLPILMCGSEACCLDFAVNRFLYEIV